MKLADLAGLLAAGFEGDPEIEIQGVCGIEEAGPGQLTFIANPKYAAHARTTSAAAVLVSPDFPAIQVATLRTANPYLAFAKAIELFHPPAQYAPGIHPTAVVHPTAEIGEGAHIGAYVVVGERVVLGQNATLLPHVVVYPDVVAGVRLMAHAHAVIREGCRLGDNVVLQNGAVIGADGFGFARNDAGDWQKIRQAAPAVLEDDVEVQANACVDRASVGETRIRAGAKIDNLVQVGHGSTVGEKTLLCAQVGLAGSTRVGSNVILAGQVGVAGHCEIGDGVVAMAQAGIPGDVAAGRTVAGTPAYDSRTWLKVSSLLPKLPQLLRDLRKGGSPPKNDAEF